MATPSGSTKQQKTSSGAVSPSAPEVPAQEPAATSSKNSSLAPIGCRTPLPPPLDAHGGEQILWVWHPKWKKMVAVPILEYMYFYRSGPGIGGDSGGDGLGRRGDADSRRGSSRAGVVS